VCENVPKRDSFVQNLMLKKAEKGYFVNWQWQEEEEEVKG
jgi:hypothetical protein